MKLKRELDKIKNISKLFRFYKLKYPKFLLLAFSTSLAYLLFSNNKLAFFLDQLNQLSYIGVFIAGLLFSFGFTTPFAIGLIIDLAPNNLFLASLIGGLGALLSDLLIFKFVKFSFEDEFNKLKNTKTISRITKLINNNLNAKIGNYLLFAFAGIIIASPLPDEIGVSLLAGFTSINTNKLAVVSFIGNTLGIAFLLII